MQLRSSEPHETLIDFLDELEREIRPDYDSLSIASARELSSGLYSGGETAVPVGGVRDLSIRGPDGDDLPIRVYAPDGEGPFPVLIWLHGGGFVLGGIETHDQTCRLMTSQTECVVVSVEYRLAPEHPFPAAVQDTYRASEWVNENALAIRGDPDRVAIGGQSAGGNLAAAATQLARQRGEDLFEYQVLIYPVTDWALDTDSYEENAEGYYLTRSKMAWFRDLYLRSDIDRANPYAVPLRATDFASLPPATVVTAGFDPLRDEGIEYARRLEDAGVPVNSLHYEDMIHGFFVMHDDLPHGRRAMDDIANDLAVAFD